MKKTVLRCGALLLLAILLPACLAGALESTAKRGRSLWTVPS